MHTQENSQVGLSRREILKTTGAAAIAAAWPGAVAVGAEEQGKAESFRIAHLTDIHIQPELKGNEGFRKCMSVVHELKPRPDLILTGGDLVMDSMATEETRVRMLWDLYKGITKDSDIPVRHGIGNHDVFGICTEKVARDNPQFGKKMFQDQLELERTTYSFDHKGWHIAMVDDIVPIEKGCYEGGFTDEVLAWLDADFKAAGDKPKLIVTHIPIVSVIVYHSLDGVTPVDPADLRSMTCANAGTILKLLRTHKVNLVLAGHLHDNEVIRHQYTTHIGEGAVCGAWWKGPQRLSREGFGVVDLHADGTFDHTYHDYGWDAKAATRPA